MTLDPRFSVMKATFTYNVEAHYKGPAKTPLNAEALTPAPGVKPGAAGPGAGPEEFTERRVVRSP